jgi:hypothetical protein
MALTPVLRQEVADQTGHRLALEVEALRELGITSLLGFAQALTQRGVPTPRGTNSWTHTTVARLLARVGTGQCLKLPRFGGVFDGFVDYGSVVATSIIASYAIGER